MTERIVTDANGRKHITTEPMPMQAKREWVGLTSEDYDSMRPRVPDVVNDFSFADVAAIVEARLREKNA